MKSTLYSTAIQTALLSNSIEMHKYETPIEDELLHPEVIDEPAATLSKRELKLAAIAEHNARHERRSIMTPEERQDEFRKECREIARSLTDSAQNSLFGTGKPKRPKRWP